MNNIFLTTEGSTGSTLPFTLIWIVAMVAVFYFLMYRPQKKQQKKHDTVLTTIATGDSVLTSSGFYGVVLDVMDDVVIIEFGNNKNCRIPMKKTAIVEIEKPNTAE